MEHHLKTEHQYFQAVKNGRKKFELRENDRNFKVDDTVVLHETIDGIYTGDILPPMKIEYILYGGVYGLPEDMCIMNF